jgi:hypothetical protein
MRPDFSTIDSGSIFKMFQSLQVLRRIEALDRDVLRGKPVTNWTRRCICLIFSRIPRSVA